MAPRDFRSRLARRAAKAGVFLPDDMAASLARYYELLSRWNRKINLTAFDDEDPDSGIDRLLLEPLVAARYIPAGAIRLMDVGSGGGSPAIPLKIALPPVDLTMVEVKARKSAFLREVVRQLDLKHARVETYRFEQLLGRPELLESFDVLTLRAVRVEGKVLHTMQAFLRPGGEILLFRGPSGPTAPDSIIPPLEWVTTYPLVETLQSRLTILGKSRVAGAHRGDVFHVEQ